MRIYLAIMVALAFVLASCQHSQPTKPLSPTAKANVRYCFY